MHKINNYFVLTFFRHEKITLTSDSMRRLPAVVRVVTMFLLCVGVCVLNVSIYMLLSSVIKLALSVYLYDC